MTQKAEVGEVWFSLEARKFFQIRGVHDDWFLCGGFCDYYEDSMTNTLEQRLSPQYLQEKAMLVPGAIDLFPEAEYDSVGWRVKEVEMKP